MESALLEEIADLWERGFVVYVHRTTFELLSYPDPERWGEWEALDQYTAVKKRLDKEGEQFIELGTLPSKVTYTIMEDFARQVADERLRERLLTALRSRKPFRYFRETVEGSTQATSWSAFKTERLTARVLQVLAEKWE